ncbi:MAG: hypothetical protein ABSA42_07665 [Terracidiphilus sp.]
MARAKGLSVVGLAAIAAILSTGMEGQAGDRATLIQEKLVSQIKVTKATADRSDIVTAGDILVLHKDGLMMCSSASSYAFSNTYSGGVLTANYNNRIKDATKSFFKGRIPFGGGGSAADAANNGCASRKFVAGEKFWVTWIVAQKDGILVSTFSDPYPDSSGNQVRYYGEIKFLFPNGPVPSADDFVKIVSEVMTVQPPDNNGDQGGQGGQPAQAAAPQAAPPPAPLPDIAPPPPPADAAPPTIAIGQTKNQVTAAFGQPVKTAKLGAKEIYYYPDMKVTFTNGKVSNVE